MAILATTNSTPKELIPTGNYIARCYQMIEIGTVVENIMGQEKVLKKVRIGWELPTELRVFKEENGEQPLVISKEYTLSLHEKSSLRKDLKSWRGKDFTEDEARSFDITKLIGVPCMLNIIHKPSKSDPTRLFEEISGITSVPKGFPVPEQITKTIVLSYDNFDEGIFNALPDFIKQKMQASAEWSAMKQPNAKHMNGNNHSDDSVDDLPF